MPCSRSSEAGPMPESCRSCGVPMEPAARITSRDARTLTLSPLRISVGARAAQARRWHRASSSSLSASAWVHTVRLARERRGLQERLGRAHAEAAALIHVEVADAGVVAGVEVVDAREAGLSAASANASRMSQRKRCLDDMPLAARAMQVVAPSHPRSDDCTRARENPATRSTSATRHRPWSRPMRRSRAPGRACRSCR